MVMTTDLEAQIVAEIGGAGWRLGPLLGLDITDGIDQRTKERTGAIATQLTAADDRVAAETAIDLMACLWPHSDPPGEWWRTPLGMAIAATTGVDRSGPVPMGVAAEMIGVTPGRVTQLADAGVLVRHPAGGVTRASVTARIAAT